MLKCKGIICFSKTIILPSFVKWIVWDNHRRKPEGNVLGRVQRLPQHPSSIAVMANLIMFHVCCENVICRAFGSTVSVPWQWSSIAVEIQFSVISGTCIRVKWSGVEWSEVEWSGIEWDEMKCKQFHMTSIIAHILRVHIEYRICPLWTRKTQPITLKPAVS